MRRVVSSVVKRRECMVSSVVRKGPVGQSEFGVDVLEVGGVFSWQVGGRWEVSVGFLHRCLLSVLGACR